MIQAFWRSRIEKALGFSTLGWKGNRAFTTRFTRRSASFCSTLLTMVATGQKIEDPLVLIVLKCVAMRCHKFCWRIYFQHEGSSQPCLEA